MWPHHCKCISVYILKLIQSIDVNIFVCLVWTEELNAKGSKVGELEKRKSKKKCSSLFLKRKITNKKITNLRPFDSFVNIEVCDFSSPFSGTQLNSKKRIHNDYKTLNYSFLPSNQRRIKVLNYWILLSSGLEHSSTPVASYFWFRHSCRRWIRRRAVKEMRPSISCFLSTGDSPTANYWAWF